LGQKLLRERIKGRNRFFVDFTVTIDRQDINAKLAFVAFAGRLSILSKRKRVGE
jgi:hypothetical protein